MKVGDLIKGYVPNPYRPQVGIVIKTETRRLGPYTQEQIDEAPIRLIHFLTSEGKMIQRYAVHVEVLDESR